MTQPSGPTDEQLQRLRLTRDRWEAIRADALAREARAPAVGTSAPDFELPLLSDRARTVRLSSFHGKWPVALIFGSYTLPPFRKQAGRLQELYRQYGHNVEFLVVYIQEAHPTDGWQLQINEDEGVLHAQPVSFDERVHVAEACALHLDLGIPTVIDDIDNTTDLAYSALPDRLYLIGVDGSIVYRSGPGPMGFKPDELEAAIGGYLGNASDGSP